MGHSPPKLNLATQSTIFIVYRATSFSLDDPYSVFSSQVKTLPQIASYLFDMIGQPPYLCLASYVPHVVLDHMVAFLIPISTSTQ